MNLLALMTLAVLVPSTDTKNADVWVRVSSNHVEIVATPEDAEAVRKKSGAGILVQCKTLKINYTAEGKVIECEGCTFYTSTGTCGKAHSAVFDLVKRSLTLTGEETTPVEWTIRSNENGEQKIVSQSMQITLPSSELGTPRGQSSLATPFTLSKQQPELQDFPSVDLPTRSSETSKPTLPQFDKDY